MVETAKGDKVLTHSQFANRVTWVKALLSGSYAQGYGKLHTTQGYCCLGVAGKALEPDASFVSEESLAGYLPQAWASDKLGITSAGNTSIIDSDQGCSVDWNDNRTLSFRQIADRVALATKMTQHFGALSYSPTELDGREPGEYASEWLAEIES